jgi:hypothetical protein
LTPVISSVQSFQTTIKNAPENVMGMVKGISDNLLTNSITTTSSSSVSTSTNNQTQSYASINNSQINNNGNSKLRQSTSSNQIASNNPPQTVTSQNTNGVNQIERTILNGDDLVSIYFKELFLNIFLMKF